MLRSEIGIPQGRNPAASMGAEHESILHPIGTCGGGLRGMR
jgi:hypothetical protein